MKRFGRIMFCFLPALLAFGLQLISIPAVGLALLGVFIPKGQLLSMTVWMHF